MGADLALHVRAPAVGRGGRLARRVVGADRGHEEWVHPDGMAAYGLGGTKHGHTGVREFLAHVPTVLGGMRLEPAEFVQSGDRVVVFGTRQVTSRSGRTETLSFVHSWTLSGGKAVRMEDIFDTAAFQRLIES
ncbi:nuclear transport factor 2 family protein [Streptomyces sp. YPW6]|nr:nuclear transport factor 2 family protein [Streptomyces sp. YPW6]